MFEQSTIRCACCPKGLNDPDYKKDPRSGESLYWLNPKLTPGFDEPVYFCGPEHATQWYLEKFPKKTDG